MKTTEERAIEAVTKRNSSCTDFGVLSVVPKFLEGTLYTIGFRDTAKGLFENYAYVPDDDKVEGQVWRNTVQLVNAVSIQQKNASWMEKLLTTSGITTWLALAITVTICYLTIISKGDLKVPEVLSNALTMILGFYFGTKATREKAT